MADIERTALEHIRRVVESALSEAPASAPAAPAGTSFTPNLLNIPYIATPGQDSAAAAGTMLLNAYREPDMNVADFISRSGQAAGKALALTHVRAALASLGVVADVRYNLKLTDLSTVLFTYRPVVAMLKHDVLREAGLTPETSSAPLYAVVVGMDAVFVYLHDPFRADNAGRALAVPIPVFYNAWILPGRELGASAERALLIPRLQVKRFVTVTTVLNIRSAPGLDADVVAQAKPGDVFEVSRMQGDWGQVGEGRWFSLAYARDL